MCLMLAVMLLMCGCGKQGEAGLAHREPAATTAPTEETVPATVPQDGDPNDVTCKGSYTGSGASNTVVAMTDVEELTNGELQAWYWAEVARYRQENHSTAPDFDRPLDVQSCDLDDSVNSWQQYFLKQALQSWHSAQALNLHSKEVTLPTEEEYQPNKKNHVTYMTDMPAAEVLYGYHAYYRPNSMHQEYLDTLPERLDALAREAGYADAAEMAKKAFGTTEEALLAFAEDYNRGYMYFTHRSHYIEPTQEELDAFFAERGTVSSGESYVDFRQILLIPEGEGVQVAADGTVTCSEEAWQQCEEAAQSMLTYWEKKNRGTEATFGETAHNQSQDPGSAENGGLYSGIRMGQLTEQLDAWCFNPARQPGDTTILRTKYGVHILYFSGSQEIARAEAEQEYYRQQQKAILAEATEMFPVTVNYSQISLTEAEPWISSEDILYPDIAHERFPEIPLYLQQDYPKTMFGGFKITTNGCGITSFAMLASYMTDDEQTPPEMCGRYGRYSHSNGTDGMIFNIESAVMGFYLKEKTYEPKIALEALEQGYIVISVQHPGYWTRAGHYIVCESVNEEGLIQVRDSNIYNYSRIRSHKEDVHKWGSITANGSGFWIFDKKITRMDACSRCGTPEGLTQSLLKQEYVCNKCETALLRRNTYLNF